MATIYIVSRTTLTGGSGATVEEIPAPSTLPSVAPVALSTGISITPSGGDELIDLAPSPQWTLRNTEASTQTNKVYTRGLLLEKGAVESGMTPVVLRDGVEVGQVNISNTYNDGSVRRFVWSEAIASLSASQTDTLTFAKKTTPSAPTPLDVTDFDSNFDVRVTATENGTAYSTTLKPLLTGSPTAYREGDVMTEWLFRDGLANGGTDHDWLTAEFYVRLYSNGVVLYIVGIENAKCHQASPADSHTYDLTIEHYDPNAAGWHTVFSETGVIQNHHTLPLAPVTNHTFGWDSSETNSVYSDPLFIDWDLDYMVSRAKCVPRMQADCYNTSYTGRRSYSGRFDSSAVSYNDFRSLAENTGSPGSQIYWHQPNHGARFSFGNTGFVKQNMASSTWEGGMQAIFEPDLMMLYSHEDYAGESLANRTTMYTWTMENGNRFGAMEWMLRDENTGNPISPTTYPTANTRGSIIKRPAVGFEDYGSSPTFPNFGWENLHRPSAFVPAMMEGWQCHERQLAYQVTSHWAFAPTGEAQDHGLHSRGTGARIYEGVRGQAWRLRDMAQALAILPTSWAFTNDVIRDVHLQDTLAYYDYLYGTSGVEAQMWGRPTRTNINNNNGVKTYQAAWWQAMMCYAKDLDAASGNATAVSYLNDLVDYVTDGTIAFFQSMDPGGANRIEWFAMTRWRLWGTASEPTNPWRTETLETVAADAASDTFSQWGESTPTGASNTLELADEMAAIGSTNTYVDKAGEFFRFTSPDSNPASSYIAMAQLPLLMAIRHSTDSYVTTLRSHWNTIINRPDRRSAWGAQAGHTGGHWGAAPPWTWLDEWDVDPA